MDVRDDPDQWELQLNPRAMSEGDGPSRWLLLLLVGTLAAGAEALAAFGLWATPCDSGEIPPPPDVCGRAAVTTQLGLAVAGLGLFAGGWWWRWRGRLKLAAVFTCSGFLVALVWYAWVAFPAPF